MLESQVPIGQMLTSSKSLQLALLSRYSSIERTKAEWAIMEPWLVMVAPLHQDRNLIERQCGEVCAVAAHTASVLWVNKSPPFPAVLVKRLSETLKYISTVNKNIELPFQG